MDRLTEPTAFSLRLGAIEPAPAKTAWVRAQRQRLLLAGESIGEPPQLAAGRLDQDVETATVRELSRA